MEILKVKTESDPKAVAGAMAKLFEDGANTVELHSIGAGAVNQAIKSIIIARGYVASNAIDLYTVPGFVNIDINGEGRTGIKFIVSKR